ncbi:hypothetical protein BDN70DRAFT_917724 [Pholiota conissans]|uniref:Histone acetyltransferase n=1 Tax=Pholiota conissans TaxID=109636 RepID=A0A9P5ZA94_9AGAR|nr:hypothetical protein BDN70DRAFT_917724 [Pholiota conissans]
MRGLAFPTTVPADREASYEYGTPISNSNVDDIPIDPALSEPPIDPALMMDSAPPNGLQPPPVPTPPPDELYGQPASLPPPGAEYQLQQYSGGPQGDPFAPQVPVPFFALPEEVPPPPPPPKPRRRKKVAREETCSFCRGDAKNKRGELESMITCHECGRSGHPSCMQLEKLGDVVRSYKWKCIECKNCEVCQEKGDDERILFCDCCDRGWHMDCVNPPIQTAPEGDWRCPICTPFLTEEEAMYAQAYPQSEHAPASPATSIREGSVASTSRSAVDPPARTSPSKSKKRKSTASKNRTRGVAKGAAAHIILSDGSDNDDPVDVVESPAISRSRGRQSRPSAKARAGALAASTDAGDDDDGAVVEVKKPPRTAAATAASAAKRKRPREESTNAASSRMPRVRLRLAIPRSAKGKDREEEEQTSPAGLFDDILGPDDRDVSKTTPANADKLAFDRSRIIADEKLAPPPPPPAAAQPTASSSRSGDNTHNLRHHTDDSPTTATATPISSGRPLRSAMLAQLSASTPKLPSSLFANINNNSYSSPAPSTPGPPPLSKFEPGVLRIRTIRFGPYDIRTWYDAPFPEEYASIPDGRLWICEFCLKYMKSRYKAIRHQMKCKMRHPPGDEIYRDGVVSIFEVDGRRNKIYCQNLCLLSKMFLDHKSLFYDVEPFLFYVITQVDDFGARFVGYFSKEKRCPKEYNLSCIMTLPVRQRQGWGNLLIDFSYLLSKIEQRLGSPEKPLSSLGAIGYRNYWTLAVMRFLEHAPDNVRLEEISSATSMTVEDVCATLAQHGLIYMRDATPPPVRPSPGQSIRYPKGRKNGATSSARKHLQRMRSMSMSMSPAHAANGHAVNGHGGKEGAAFVPPAHYEVRFDRAKAAAYVRAWEAKGYLRLRPEKLQWTPYLVQRNEREREKDLPTVDNVAEVEVNGEAEKVKEAEAEPPKEVVEVEMEAEPEPKEVAEVEMEAEPEKVAEESATEEKKAEETPEVEMKDAMQVEVEAKKAAAERPPDPVTPSVALNGHMVVDTPEEEERDALPMAVDSPLKGRTRSAQKEKERARTPEPERTPEPVAARVRTRSGQVRVVEAKPPAPVVVRPKQTGGTGRGRGRPPKKKVEEVVVVVEAEEAAPVSPRQLRSETRRRRGSSLSGWGSEDAEGSVDLEYSHRARLISKLVGVGLAVDGLEYGHDPQFHQNALGQALGTQYQRPQQDYRPASHSPPQPPAPQSHSPLTFAVPAQSPALKRKQPDGLAHTLKRRRDTAPDDPDAYDLDPQAQGAKHWTDDEKSRLFNWLMGPGQEDHWNALRATKNSCLRECANEVFGGKKTYQALKGCYERNFNLFKQIYAFESAHGQPAGGGAALAALSEADRLREYERRLALVRKGSDVGSITARTIDHWHRVGWYDLFYRRWHGDPATTRPVQVPQGRTSISVGGASGPGGTTVDDDDDDPAAGGALDSFHDTSTSGMTSAANAPPPPSNPNSATANTAASSSMNGLHMHEQRQQQQVNYINPQELRDTSAATSTSTLRTAPTTHASHAQAQPSIGLVLDPTSGPSLSLGGGLGLGGLGSSANLGSTSAGGGTVNLALSADLVSKCIQYLDLQARVAQEKLAYLKRRESREQADFNTKKDGERRGKTERAFEILNNPNIDQSLKQAATEYLRKTFLQDM